MKTKHLLTPGPVELPPDVLLAGAAPLIGHRSPQFSALLETIEGKLSRLLGTDEKTVILPCSGTGALEALAVNFLGRGDRFVSVSCGVFGDRFREIAAKTGAEAICVDVPPGFAADPGQVRDAVEANTGAKVLLLTHNETSTGVINPISEIISAVPPGIRPIVLVDGVSSVGAAECLPEEWGIDGLAFASQKGLLTPPGLGFVWLSKRGWGHVGGRDCASYTYDLKLHKKYLLAKPTANPFTPPVSLYFALDRALDEILSCGTKEWFFGRRRFAAAFAAGLSAMGFELLVKDASRRSPGLTAFGCPFKDAGDIRENLRDMGIETAGGQAGLKGRLIRIAHYGASGWPELAMILGALYGAAMPDIKTSGDFINKAWRTWEDLKND